MAYLTSNGEAVSKNRSSIDAGLVHLLAFECRRAKRSTVAEISHDLKACFDRMQVGQSNIYALKRNVDRNLLKCRGLTVTRIRHHVKTGLGVSEGIYQNEP